MTNQTHDMYHDHDGLHWSGNPNQALIAEIALIPTPEYSATALDIGAGEGADAMYLATHGYTVTALEPSEIASSRITCALTTEELRRHVTVRTEPFETAHLEEYDLLTHGEFPRHVTGGMGAGHTIDRVLHIIRRP